IEVRAFSPDGRRLWSLEPSGLFKEWGVRPPGRTAIRLVDREDSFRASVFAVSPDGERVATLAELRSDQGAPFAVQISDAEGKKGHVPRPAAAPRPHGPCRPEPALPQPGPQPPGPAGRPRPGRRRQRRHEPRDRPATRPDRLGRGNGRGAAPPGAGRSVPPAG